MKFRGLLAAAVVLLALGGVLYWSEHHAPKETPASSESTKIVQIDPAAVTSVTITAQGAEPVVLTKASPGHWQITAPTAAAADNDAVSGMLSTLAPLNADRVVDEKAADLSQYGLSHPSLELNVTEGGKSTRLLLGDSTPTGEDVYVAMGGDPRVFTASSSVKSSLNKTESDLRDKRLIPVEAASVSQIQLDREGESMAFGRVQDGWQMQKPQPWATDSYQVDDLVQQVVGAKWDPSMTPKDAAASWSHAQPFATVKIASKAGTDTLDVRKDREDYFAKSSALGQTWKIDPSLTPALASALGRSVDEYRNKQLFDFGYSDPDKIEYRSGSTSITLTHAGNDWWSNGKKLNNDSVESVVTALRDLTASKFADSGFSSPTIEITVTSKNGKQVETAQIQKASDGAIARRTDNPSLYVLDSATVTSLTSAIAGVKPAGATVPAG